jgi:hypothetical protein
VLAKGFWALVNLSLYDIYKDEIIARGGVEKIVTAMRCVPSTSCPGVLRASAHLCSLLRRFPEMIELQYRACFALINLCIKVHTL